MGPTLFTHADYCPIVVVDDVLCDDISASAFDSEVLGKESKCLDLTNKEDGFRTAKCHKSKCNNVNHTFDFDVAGDTYVCESDFQQIYIGENIYECPRLTAVCPE